MNKSTEPIAWNISFYADSRTFVGADTNPTYDADDELAFMVSDLGEKSSATAYPTSTLNNFVCEVKVTDPLNSDLVLGYIYLFLQNGSLSQDAGVDYVSYDFAFGNVPNNPNSINFDTDDYKTTYMECLLDVPGANPENSTITTANYQMGYSQRWTEDVMRITAGNATGTDILDRHQFFVNAGTCTSTEDCFSNSEGAHIAIKDGPIRAIRSVMGAASGVFMQLDALYTACEVNYNMYFRLHPANGFNDVLDMNPAANRMRYFTNQNLSGETIGGNGGSLNTTNPDTWALYSGNQGSLVVVWDYLTDMSLGTSQQYNNGNGTVNGNVRAYYDDNGNNAVHDCTGDGAAYGSSGFTLRTKQCTDRRYDWNQYVQCRPENVKFFYINRIHHFYHPMLQLQWLGKSTI